MENVRNRAMLRRRASGRATLLISGLARTLSEGEARKGSEVAPCMAVRRVRGRRLSSVRIGWDALRARARDALGRAGRRGAQQVTALIDRGTQLRFLIESPVAEAN